ncbi:glucose PTS transporter subunit IIA [Frisingicoccus sp.]|uniref:PTS transporter subunit IIABC n=1 Tax=Frisingicoccus sp. TaxID=1918627 RepID=UPI003AB7EF78
MKDKVFGVLQRVGRSFMLPIALLPVAGLLLGIGGSFTNETMLNAYGLMGFMGPGTLLYAVFTVMKQAGDIVFANLPILFAMGVAIGMARREKEVAALAAAVAFFIMHASISAMITINGGAENLLAGASASVVGITSLQMGVFGGIIVGLGVAALHNRFYQIELPQVLSFFGGTRFVPIISALVYTLVGILMYYIWPPIQGVIYSVGNVVLNSGYIGTWVYGVMERALIPFGLHHVFYLPFWQTAVGGTMEVGGRLIEGAQNIFFAQLADPSVEKFAVSATRFMSGKFPLMIFGLPGAALAMYKTARPEKRKAVEGLLLSAALTSMLTGITEPLEFTFLFVAPALYAIHCVFAGAAYMLMHIFNVGVGMTFSGGFIDLFLFGILQGNAKTNWIWVVIVGIVYFIVYYFLFTFLIRKFDLKTPGREASDEVKLYHRSDVDKKRRGGKREGMKDNGALNSSGISGGSASGGISGGGMSERDEISARICDGLGGRDNISDVDCCATRLRCTVYQSSKVKTDVLKSTGASGVIQKGNGVQVIYGPRVTVIKSHLEDYLEKMPEAETGQSTLSAKEEPKTSVISSPYTGIAADIHKAPDEGFASGAVGDGAFVELTGPDIVAPADGTVSFVFDTRHALGFKTLSGVALLIHVGIDTVSLNGEGFDVRVKEGDLVKKGDLLMRVDLNYIRQHAPSLASPIVCTELDENSQVRLLHSGPIKAGEDLFQVQIGK